MAESKAPEGNESDTERMNSTQQREEKKFAKTSTPTTVKNSAARFLRQWFGGEERGKH